MKQKQSIKNFLYSHNFSDGLKISFGVLLPALIFAQLNQFILGITISLGALCVSIVDNPGPFSHKRNGMAYANLFIFLTSMLTGILSNQPILIGIEIAMLCFTFSMFNVWGNRASTIGTAALIIMVLSLDEQKTLEQSTTYSLYVLMGGLWYMGFSLSIMHIRPFRLAQQALGECISEISTYIRLKAAFYQPKTSLALNYRKLLDQQVVVHEKQDSVRALLFHKRMIKDPNPYGRQLIMMLVDMIDLFEESTATLYDYKELRATYGGTKALKAIHKTLYCISNELDLLASQLTADEEIRPSKDFLKELNNLKAAIDEVETGYHLPNLVLKKILINIRNMVRRTEKVFSYATDGGVNEGIRSQKDLPKFVSHQEIDFKQFKENLSLHSTTFRYAVRMAIVCLLGFVVSHLFSLGHHSYWILLTIIVILKPSFSLTKQRNYERIIGTVIGGLIGVAILIFVKDETPRFIFLLGFMVGAYSFQRVNYKLSVLFLTPYLLILFSFLGANNITIAKERIVDTLVGSIIAFAASYFIFPSWESKQLKIAMKEAAIANYNYLIKLAEGLLGQPLELTDYKLIRKEVYVRTANLNSAFQRMLSEPKNRQKNSKEIHKFAVLNHMLSSYIANLVSVAQQEKTVKSDPVSVKWVRKALHHLRHTINELAPGTTNLASISYPDLSENLEDTHTRDFNADLLAEQLQLVYRLTKDIRKLAESLETE
ncbi:MAG: FUSC family protein [Sphingobacteriaceae bacterium]|nr:FUSC family protein [Sphingobacteriaceae bacterium]